MSKRFCRCGAVVDGACPKCDKARRNATKRGYGYDWQKLRERILAEQPLCVDCLETTGRPTPAVEVHHIEGIQAAPHKRLDPQNLVPLCEDCHDKRHGRPLYRWRKDHASSA